MNYDELSNKLEKCVSLLRSAHSIAEREGSNTNWEAFREQVREAILYACDVPKRASSSAKYICICVPNTYEYFSTIEKLVPDPLPIEPIKDEPEKPQYAICVSFKGSGYVNIYAKPEEDVEVLSELSDEQLVNRIVNEHDLIDLIYFDDVEVDDIIDVGKL